MNSIIDSTKSRAFEEESFLSDSESESESEVCNDGKTTTATVTGLIDVSRVFQEELKYNPEDEEQYEQEVDNAVEATASPAPSPTHSQDTTTSSTSTSTNTNRVHFDDTVSGIEIVSYRDYNANDRLRLWNSFAEIQTNAERNITEFRADGWEWRNATEESEMVVQEDFNSNNNNNSSSSTLVTSTTSNSSSIKEELVHPASLKRKRKFGASSKQMGRIRRRRARHY